MERFRYSGRGWRVAPCVQVLGELVETMWPARHAADGTAASAQHSKWPASDHGPDPNGIVRALDVGVIADQGATLTGELARTRDPRIAYVIHNRRILRSYPKPGIRPWTWAPYSGPNPHTGHVHISTVRDRDADNDRRPWPLDLGGNMITVQQLQQALVDAGHDLGTFGPNGDGVDGEYGPKTHAAWVAACTVPPKAPPVTLPPEVLQAGDVVRLVRRRDT